jgi:hypothetical protein
VIMTRKIHSSLLCVIGICFILCAHNLNSSTDIDEYVMNICFCNISVFAKCKHFRCVVAKFAIDLCEVLQNLNAAFCRVSKYSIIQSYIYIL